MSQLNYEMDYYLSTTSTLVDPVDQSYYPQAYLLDSPQSSIDIDAFLSSIELNNDNFFNELSSIDLSSIDFASTSSSLVPMSIEDSLFANTELNSFDLNQVLEQAQPESPIFGQKRKASVDSLSDDYSDTNSSSESTICITQKRSKRVKTMSSDGYDDEVKKRSNKEAALRYRQKKLKQKEELFRERDEFERENQDLKKKIDDIQIEINFVKNILVEMLLKKNLLSNINLTTSK